MEKDMKLISDFHDYYDVTIKYGYFDASDVPFIRKTLRYNDYNNSPTVIKKLWDNIGDRAPSNYYLRGFATICRFFIVFCGKLYPVVCVLPDGPPATSFFYTFDELYDYINKEREKKKNLIYNEKEFYNGYRQHFESTKIDRDFLIENKVSIASLVAYTNINADEELLINPNLKQFHFYKVLDVFQAYQELEQWVSGCLAYPPNFMVEIEDKYKISAHGFDVKYGFRKRPTGEK